ncbi:helix-turn-helix domain-containing protein [Streptomyces sp. NPDC048441]|uniref:helix-turn-helix domain-containing protein n=1 Tax=Streptomyces sp. NPDC048441 TaxID=3365552 RepID=UPI003716EA72
MRTIEISTESLPRATRFGWWHDTTAQSLIPTTMSSDRADDFPASATILDLGGIEVVSMAYPPLAVRRTSGLIRERDPHYLTMSLTVEGHMGIEHAGREASFGTGELLVYDSSRPFAGWAESASGQVRHVVAQFPKVLLPLSSDQVHQVVGRPMAGTTGFAALLSYFLLHVTENPHHYQEKDVARLRGILLDLIVGSCGHLLQDPKICSPEARRRGLLLHIRQFIECRLHDPALTPETVAVAHHISLRQLHRLFRDQDTTAAAWIRAQRLEHARSDLADSRHRLTPVHRIAERWGFTHHATFTRAFRAVYGMSPSEYRVTPLPGCDRSR